MVNLDANASFGVLPAVWQKLKELETVFPNPSAIHQEGQRAKFFLEWSRRQISELLELKRGVRVIFTSGATEANAQVLLSPLVTFISERPKWRLRTGEERDSGIFELLTGATEHPAVLDNAARWDLWPKGSSVQFKHETVPTGRECAVDLNELEKQLSPDTVLVSVMLANNETGELHPLKEIAQLIRQKAPQAWIHTDAVQGVGKAAVKFEELDVDYLTLSGHKIGGLPGAAALVAKADAPLAPLLLGGGQELRLRAGTENLPGIVSLGEACRLVHGEGLSHRAQGMARNRSFLVEQLKLKLPQIRFNFETRPKIPNTLSLTIDGVLANDLVVALDLAGIAVSAGAACSSGKPQGSHVLAALGLSQEQIRSTLRVSLTGSETEEELKRAVQSLGDCVSRIVKKGSPGGG